MKVKAQFWTAVDKNPFIADVTALPASEVCRLAGTTTINKWAEVEGFKEWFLDKDGIKSRISYGAELAIDKLIEILNHNPTGERGEPVTTANQLTAAKELLSYSGHRPADKTEHKVTQGQLPEDEAGLRKYIAAQAKKLKVLPSE
jgi:hypothetical protein